MHACVQTPLSPSQGGDPRFLSGLTDIPVTMSPVMSIKAMAWPHYFWTVPPLNSLNNCHQGPTDIKVGSWGQVAMGCKELKLSPPTLPSWHLDVWCCGWLGEPILGACLCKCQLHGCCAESGQEEGHALPGGNETPGPHLVFPKIYGLGMTSILLAQDIET